MYSPRVEDRHSWRVCAFVSHMLNDHFIPDFPKDQQKIEEDNRGKREDAVKFVYNSWEQNFKIVWCLRPFWSREAKYSQKTPEDCSNLFIRVSSIPALWSQRSVVVFSCCDYCLFSWLETTAALHQLAGRKPYFRRGQKMFERVSMVSKDSYG